MTKNVLFFGDSNTWGFIPATEFDRYPYEKRICGVLQSELGSGFKIIEEALNGRMTVFDDPMGDNKNGSKQLPFILDSHRPLDMVIIMLGVNDMKHYMNLTAIDSAMGVNKLIDIVKLAGCGVKRQCPEILIISPAQYIVPEKPFGRIFEGAEEKTKGFAAAYQEIAESRKVHFFDAANVAVPPITGDGVHIDEYGARSIAESVADMIRKTFE